MKKKKEKSKKEFEEWALNVADLNIYSAIYEKQKNPILPWLAFKTCRELGGKTPEWVLAYFEECARNINKMDEITTRPEIGLFKALKFTKTTKGERTFMTELKQVLKYLPATIDSYMLAKIGDRKKPELKRMADIFSTVAGKLGLDEAVINKHYYRYKNIVPELLRINTVSRPLAFRTLRKRYPSMVRS